MSRSAKKAKAGGRPRALAGLIERPLPASLLLLAWALVLLLPGVSTLPVNDRDEAKFGRAAIEMAERDEWLVPTFGNDFVANPDKELDYEVDENGRIDSDYRFDKPPGVYWLMRASLALVGERRAAGPGEADVPVEYLPTPRTGAALRLPAIVSSWVVAVVILGFGRSLYGPRAGFWAAFAWTSCLQVMIHGRLIVADMPMIAAVAAAMWAAWQLLAPDQRATQEHPADGGPWRRGWWWLWALALAWGFAVKGPIAWIVPVLSLLLARWVFLRRPLPWGRLAPVSTLVLVLVLTVAWALPANLATDWNYAREGLGLHVVDRGLEPMNGRLFIPVLPYLLAAPLSLLPWGALIPLALWRRDDAEKTDARRGFLLGWLLAPYLIFAFYATQLPHYVLPGFPAFFLLLTRGGWPRPEGRLQRGWIIGTWALAMTVALVLAVFCLRVDWEQINLRGVHAHLLDLRQLLYAIAALLATLGTACLFFFWRRGLVPFVAALLVAALLTQELSLRLRASHSTLALENIWKQLPPQDELRAWRYREPSLIYYAGREWTGMGAEPDTAERWLSDLDDQLLVVEVKRWRLDWPTIRSLWAGDVPEPVDDHSEFLDEVASRQGIRRVEATAGYNVAQTSWTEVAVVTGADNLSSTQRQMLLDALEDRRASQPAARR